MTAYAVFEHRKEDIARQLEQEKDAPARIAAAQLALEQIACVLAQEEEDGVRRQRMQAVMALVRRAPTLLGACGAKGELVVSSAAEDKKRAFGLKAAGAAILALLAVHQLISGETLYALLQLAGAALLAFGTGTVLPAGAGGMRAAAQTEIDCAALLARMGELCRAADVCVSDLELLAGETEQMRLTGTADEATLDLLVAMMEAKASGRDEAALRVLDRAEQYLRMIGVETVMYSAETAEHFDVLPTVSQEKTIRPALVRDGTLIRRGLASRRMERSVGV